MLFDKGKTVGPFGCSSASAFLLSAADRRATDRLGEATAATAGEAASGAAGEGGMANGGGGAADFLVRRPAKPRSFLTYLRRIFLSLVPAVVMILASGSSLLLASSADFTWRYFPRCRA